MTDDRILFLADSLDQNRMAIERYLYPGRVKWEKLIGTIRHQAEIHNSTFANEQIWTFLMACGYTLSSEVGFKELTRVLTGSDLLLPRQPQIWIEVSPLPPRQKEGNTFIDLALGTISRRSPTKSGIELNFTENNWVCFCEMKYDSDISPKVTHDVNRNQLLRIIENALCFQKAGKLADKIYVTLVTRKESQKETSHKKYNNILDEYRINPHSIAGQLNNSPQGVRKQTNWHYPEDLEERIHNLKLNWVSYEELFSRMPAPSESGPNQVYREIQHTWEYYGLSPGDWYQDLLAAETEALAGGGVLSYTPLMIKLEECSQDKKERKRIALRYLPMALSCALQNSECLQDIKNVAKTYPDLIPDILACAKNLRKDKLFSAWTEYESKQYRDFIVSLGAAS